MKTHIVRTFHIALSALALTAAVIAQTPAGQPRRLEVLFVGRTTAEHNASRYAPMLKAALAPQGFNFSFTSDLTDLNTANLSRYDALLMYADHPEITSGQLAALLDFVAGGKGFVGVHTTSAAFPSTPGFAGLIGARGGVVGTGELTAAIANAAHPAMRGLRPLAIADEAFAHQPESPDTRTVLMTRTTPTGSEPVTWAKVYGKGRVLYTSYGHDDRAWSDPGFQALLGQAVRWTAGTAADARLTALDIKPLRYSNSVPVPNYERRTPLPRLQQPLTTAEAAKHLQIPPGFTPELFASEPLITGNPEAMAWDERGRLWIAETKDYPNNLQPEGQGNDVIKIIEDTDGDGRGDRATVFADKLSIVSSLVFADGGIIISQANSLVALKDTNGDDKADTRTTLITGFGTRDTHALASNLRYGLDNWIWGAVGYSGFNGTVGGQTFNFNQALYRFRPDGTRMEHMATFTNNTWGLAFNETGDVFGSTANGEHSVHVGVAKPYYDNVKGLSGDGKRKLDGHYAMHANTQRIRQVDVQGGFTAAAGHNFYTARSFPEEYWNRIAFVNEPTGHVVHRAVIDRKGSGFIESDGWNLAASDDEWFAPVHAEVGPDGAVWILDFYDFIIQHNPVPTGAISSGYTYLNGRGNAYDTPLREHARGRIYRLVWTGAKPSARMSLDARRPDDLVRALENDNMFWRLTAQRLIVERGNTDVVPALVEILAKRTVDAIGLNSPAVHAAWTLNGLGALDGSNAAALTAVERALTHPAAGVRKAAASVLPKTPRSLAALLAAGALLDLDLNTRLNALLTISTMPASLEAGRAVYAASKAADVINDEWLPEAVWIAATRHRDGFFQAYADDVSVSAFTRTALRGARGERAGGLDWSAPSIDDAGWQTIAAPRVWAETALGDHLGTVWFRRTIELPSSAAGAPALIRFGIVDDTDITYINGKRINATTLQRNMTRQYSIPAGVLVAGTNTIAVRISNVNGRGGFVPDAPPAPGAMTPTGGTVLTGMRLKGDNFDVSLAGDWKAKVEEVWDGGRRREIQPSMPIAEQFLLANSPVSDMFATPPTNNSSDRGPSPSAPSSPGTTPDGVLAVTLSVVPGEMKFDRTTISARTGQRIALTLNNPDDMQHNVVIFKRGTMAQYEKELFGSMNDANAQARGFVPDSPNVLVASRLLNAHEATVIEFDAPAEPGDYPFVCSFPGHWILMRGILRIE